MSIQTDAPETGEHANTTAATDQQTDTAPESTSAPEAQAPEQAPEAPPAASAPETEQGPWLTGELADNESLKGFESPQALAEAYLKTQQEHAAPESYEVKYPEGLPDVAHASDEEMAGFKEKAKELGLTQSQFESLLAFDVSRQYDSISQEVGTAPESMLEPLKQEWGENYQGEMDAANKALERYLDEDLEKLLLPGKFREDGKDTLLAKTLRNHPGIIKLFNRLGHEIGEDSLAPARGSGTPRSAADILYGKTHN